MLKWAVGQRNPTPGQLTSCYTSTSTEESTSCLSSATDRLHLARRRNSRGAVRKASVRSLRRVKHDKENQPCLISENVPSRTRDNLRLDQMPIALRDVSNSPDPYTLTPQRRNIKRRQSHPLNVITKQTSCQQSKSAPTNTLDFLNCYRQSELQSKPVPHINLPQPSHRTPKKRKTPTTRHYKRLGNSNNEPSDVVDMRKPNSTLKSLSTMQIEYSPGPLTATQSLIALRQRLTSSLSNGVGETPQGMDNPLYYALNPTERPASHGITISCNEQSPMLEGLLEEKSILEQVGDKTEFLNVLKKENTKLENTLVSSLSQRLEWLRLNNSLKNDLNISLIKHTTNSFLTEKNPGINETSIKDIFKERRVATEELVVKKRRDCDMLKRQKCVVRRKARRNVAADTIKTSCCDKEGPKIPEKPKLMGLTLPLGIPSPITSEDSGLCSLGLEGIHPLSSSPIEEDEVSTLTEAAMSKYHPQTDESTSSSLVVNKCSPSSICSSLRKRLNEDDYESNGSRDTWNEEMIPLMKTPKLAIDERLGHRDGSLVTLTGSNGSFFNDGAAPSPLALVEKRSRSRRCLRFVSPGSSTCQRRLSASRRPLSLSCPRLRDGRQGAGELELSVYSHFNLVTVHVGRGSDLHKPAGTACNAYVKVALVPSCERTFFRTPVQRESSCPNFNEKFSFELQPEDLNKRILVSVWHRDRDNRKSEFLGCVSIAVKNAVRKEISGSFRLVVQSGGSKTSNQQRSVQSSPGPSTSGQQSMMARRSESSSIEEVITIDEEPTASPEKHCKFSGKKKINDDSSFLRHLELEPEEGEPGRAPLPEATAKGGRTPFTTTKQLTKQPGSGFGFSIAWIQPPRVERVEAGQAADRAGIRPGDYVIFVDRFNVVTMSEEQVLQIIKSCGNELTLEIYRKSSPNGVVEPSGALPCPTAPTTSFNPPRSSTACSATTSTSLDLSKRRLHLPQVAFTNEAAPLNPDETRKRAIYQLLNKEQNYAVNLQFGVNRFLVPLTERRDFLNPSEHHTLFQNIEELLRLTEDAIELAMQEEVDSIGSFIGRLYLKRIPTLTTAYRRYCSGIKRADCLLVEKSKNTEFTRFCAEPPVPRRRPDLTTFLHKPLEHYREMLKLLQTILNLTKSSDGDHLALSRVVHEMQTTYREVTAGLMEPEVEGRPLLSVQDLESRLVFTRCKPFVLSAPGRQWIFGGDLSRVEGRAVRPFWALLFTDMMVFAKVSRDRVLFITEEPLSLMAVSQAFFNIRKRANEFRLLLNSGGSGTDSPANAMCGPDLVLSRTPRKSIKCRSIALRAPTPELKAVWQSLIQRQIIYLNTTRGGTPASSPLESPDPPTTLSVGTLDSLSLRRQTPLPDTKVGILPQRSYSGIKDMDVNPGSTKQLNELIDHKCRQLGKTKTGKGSAMHLAEWMKGQLGNAKREYEEDHVHHEPEPEIWSQEELKRRSTQLNVIGMLSNRCESRCEELDLVSERSVSRNTERSHQSFSTSESQTTVKSNHPEKTVSVCRQCHKTCLNTETKTDLHLDDEDDYDDTWGSLMVMGMCGILPAAKAVVDPFTPAELPSISVLPPTPDNQPRNTNWDTGLKNNNNYISCSDKTNASNNAMADASTLTSSPVPTIRKPHVKISEIIDADDDEETPEGSLLSDEPPYRTLSSSGLRRFGTLNSLERVGSDEILEDDKTEEESEESEKEDDEEDKIEVRTYPPEVAHSIRGWTARAGSFVAEKMALFERLSSADNTTTVRKTSFLERYLKPSGDNHLDSPPDPGTNTSSSGRGEDEGETSGATSGEEVWGTPTSGGEFEEELVGESSALSFMESPHGSLIGTDDDTEQLMEDLLISLPMLAARAPGVPPRRRLEPLMEEDDTESSSAPCSPKPLHELKSDQGRGSTGYQQQHHDNCPKFGSSVIRPLSSRRDQSSRPRIGTIDRALGIHSDEEPDEPLEDSTASPSLLHRLGLRRNREEGRKSSRLTSLFESKFKEVEISKIASSSRKKLQKQMSRFPSPRRILSSVRTSDSFTKTKFPKRNFTLPGFAKKAEESCDKTVDIPDVEVIKAPKSRSFQWPRGEDVLKTLRLDVFASMKVSHSTGNKKDHFFKRHNALKRKKPDVDFSGFLSGRKVEGTSGRNSAAYGGKPLFKYLFNKDTVDDIPTTLPRTFTSQRPNEKQLERRFWKQLRRRRSSASIVQPRSPQVAV